MTDEQPFLRVVRGDPTPEELAALIAVLTARTSATPPPQHARSAWADPARRLGLTHRPGRGGWRRSALPT